MDAVSVDTLDEAPNLIAIQADALAYYDDSNQGDDFIFNYSDSHNIN